MTVVGHADQRPYLTVVTAPARWDRDHLARVLAETGGLDLPTVRLGLGREPPVIVGQIDPAAAPRVIDALAAAAGDAFACTLDDLARLGPTCKIKDLAVEPGLLRLELWRGPRVELASDDVQILVRAQLRATTVEHRPRGTGGGVPPLSSPGLAGTLGAPGAGRARGEGVAAGWSGAVREGRVRTSQKLDVHAADGTVFQIDGDKFGYRALGAMRGHGDKINMDRMCELLAHLAPNEVVDTYYELWRPPPGCDRLRLPDMRVNGDDPAFAFYSRWAALMYRHVMGA